MAYDNGKFYPLDSPLAALKFPGFTFLDMVRFGLVTAYLRYFSILGNLGKIYRGGMDAPLVYGKSLYRVLFEPLLVGKFGPYYDRM